MFHTKTLGKTSTLIPADQTLYQALRQRGLLKEPNDLSGLGHLVKQGEIGLSSDNGESVFLAPGRHILYSPLHTFKGVTSIENKKIVLNNITIVTIDNSEMGLSKKLGDDILLEPGQHILVAPHCYVNSERIDKNYVKLGAHHWISVPIGQVAVAIDQGKKIIITPTILKVDKEHEQYIICTNGGIYKTKSPTFQFNSDTGFKSIQLEDIELDQLNVNTQERMSLSIKAAVRYKIDDPVRAFLITEDVVGDIKKQAHATLTSVFSQLSIDEIRSGISTTNISHMKGKEKEIPHDMLHHATDLFMKEFQNVVKIWGVNANLINITSLDFDKTFQETVKNITQKRMEATTNRLIVETQNEAEIKKAEREKQIQEIQAEAAAEVMKKNADAKLYAAEKELKAAQTLSENPLAAELALLNKQVEYAKALGDKTTVVTDLGLQQFRTKDKKGNLLLFNPKNKCHEKLSEVQEKIEVDQKVPIMKK